MAEIVVKRKRKRRFRPARPAGVFLALLLLLAGLLFLFSSLNRQLPYSPLAPESIAALRAAAPREAPQREAVVEAGLTLLGRVPYFWGGKSDAPGWDGGWGEPRKVTSRGSESTGDIRPYGLDCSGFVAWCYAQLGLSPKEVEERVGRGTWNQWDRSAPIKWRELRVGDWAFQNKYPTDQGNHIGLCMGFDEKGRPLFLHCAAGFNNVVVTGAGEVFRYARRPLVYEGLEPGEIPAVPSPAP